MNRYFLFTNTDRELKLVNVDDIISITFDFGPYKQQFEIQVKGEAPQYFTVPNRKQNITEGEAVALITEMMYDMATTKHPVFNWAEFCRVKKVGG